MIVNALVRQPMALQHSQGVCVHHKNGLLCPVENDAVRGLRPYPINREEFPVNILKRMGELGFLGIPYPEEYGGSGGDLTTLCIFFEELACVSAAVTTAAAVQINGVAAPVFLFGTEDQKEKYLVPSIRGDKIGAIAMTEPEAGSDVASIRTYAKKVADCQW